MQAASLKVFVIDDDDIYQYLTQKELEKSERVKSISIFSDGRKALNFLHEFGSDASKVPNIIFLDVNMPILSGWTFIEEFKSLNIVNKADIKIYMISSSFDRRDIEKAGEYEEIADYLVKPVSRLQIASILDKNEKKP